MRCLYCGIRLKIADKAHALQHCPECSVRIECESRPDARRCAEDRDVRALSGSVRRRHKAAFASMKNA